MAPLLVGRPGFTEILIVLLALAIPIAIVAFVVWIAKRARRDAEG